MYIAVHENVPDHMVPVLVAHTAINAHIAFNREYLEANGPYLFAKCNYKLWLANSFRKCVLRVNQKEFQKIAELPIVFGGYENSVMNGDVSCIAVCPREENPNVLKFAKLWAPKIHT